MRLALFDLDNTLLAGDSDFEWAQFLIEKGADLNAKTTAGQTALDIASNVAPKGKVERNLVPLAYWKGSVDLLLKAGAKPVSAAVTQTPTAVQ